MFCRWPRTWALLKSIILRHLFGCSSVVLLIGAASSSPFQIPRTNERSSPGCSGKNVTPPRPLLFTKPHIYGSFLSRARRQDVVYPGLEGSLPCLFVPFLSTITPSTLKT